MASNNTSDACGFSPSFWIFKDQIYFFTFYILTPIYFFVAMTGQTICLVAYVKRSRVKAAYAYQVYVTASQTCEVMFFTIFVILNKWLSGIESAGFEWYRHLYVPMWLSAHLVVPMSNSFVTVALLVSVSMAADRVFAMAKPFIYKDINRKRHQTVALIACIFLGVSTSVFDCFRFDIVECKPPEFDNVMYCGVVNTAYVGSRTASWLANVRNAVRVGALAALVLCNIVMVILYRKRAIVKPGDMRRSSENKMSDKTLMALTLSQSILTTCSISAFVSFYVIVYLKPQFSLCEGLVMACVMDAILEIGAMLEFFVVISVDKNVRKNVIDMFRTCCKANGM